MLRYLFIVLLLSQAALAQKLSMDQRRTQILKIVDEELKEVTRLAKQQNFGTPELVLRISELNLEKARLWREVENEKYLSIAPEDRRGTTKKEFFKRSSQYFEEANDSAMIVSKRFPSYSGMGEVYYILATNYKELGDNSKAEKYFVMANKKSKGGTAVSQKSKMALADYNFNAHKYKEAVPLYESALSQSDDKWWTKDAFNLAWSYYRMFRYDKAIALMKDIHRKSASDKYIDMRAMVERDIGLFYIDSGRMEDAVKFYESQKLNYTEQFVKIASAITSQGKFTQAEKLLDQASKFEKDRDRRVQIYVAQLDLYDKYAKIEEHLKVCQNLLKLHQEQPLAEEEFKRFSYHVNKKAAELQKSTASDLYKTVPKVQKKKSSQAIAYFEISSELNPSQKGEKVFFQGETAYAANDFPKAIGLYIKAFDGAKASNDKKIMSQSMEGMISSLGQSSLDPKTADRFYVPVYSRYLSMDSKSKRANSIYVKLFNTQFGAGDITASERTMAAFAESFPEDYKTQEGMLAKVMEHYRTKNDNAKVRAYINEINQGKYRVSKKYADALRSLVTKLQIDGVQQSLQKGEKDVALKGYHMIYDNPESTPKAKVNAAYNLAALYYEMGDSGQSYKWGVIAVKDMETSDVINFSDSFLSISSGLFLKQHFSQSADLSYRVLAKLCKQNSTNKVVAYKNAVFIALANNDLDKAIEIKDLGPTCLIPDNTITEVSVEILKDLGRAKRWEPFEAQIDALEKNSRNYPLLIVPYEELRKVYQNLGDVSQAREVEEKQTRFYNLAKSQKLDIPVDALDLIAFKLMGPLLEKKQKLDQISMRFPEDEFNSAVKLKLQTLDQMATHVNTIQQTGSGKAIVQAYKYVIEAYESFGEELRKFSPEGKNPEYVASFQKAMSEVYNPILANARKQRSEIRKLINDNKILSPSNFSVLFQPMEDYKRYITSKEAVLMERGGKR